ncbi:hypothetical protein GCM10027406_16090 [Leifsonia lichenia]
MRVRTRWISGIVAAFAVVVGIGGLYALASLHAATADWWPQAIPTRVQYDHHDFSCLDGGRPRPAERSEVDGLEPRGHTVGGGVIYAPPGNDTPTGIVVSGNGELRHCSLSGGP